MDYFCETLDQLKASLANNGFGVMPVLLPCEIRHMDISKFLMLEYLTANTPYPIRREDVPSWQNIRHLYPSHSMLLNHYVGHAGYVWDLRQNRTIANIFASLYGCQTKDLLVSFDGMSIHFPPEWSDNANRGVAERGRNWAHVDQSYFDDTPVFQSYVSEGAVLPGDATLKVLRGSHKLQLQARKFLSEKYAGNPKKLKDMHSNWFKLEEDEYQWYLSQCEEISIINPPGSIIIWDSRTIHWGVQSSRTRNRPNTRHCVYLSYSPRSYISPSKLASTLKKRILAFEDMRMTTHRAHDPKIVGKHPDTHGKGVPDFPPLPPPPLTELGMCLIGYPPLSNKRFFV